MTDRLALWPSGPIVAKVLAMVALGIPRPVALYWGRRWVRIMRRRRIEAARRIP